MTTNDKTQAKQEFINKLKSMIYELENENGAGYILETIGGNDNTIVFANKNYGEINAEIAPGVNIKISLY